MSTLVIQPSGKDNSLYENGPTLQYGSITYLLVEATHPDYLWHVLMSFDVSSLPANAVVTAASLGLYYFDKSGTPVGDTIAVDRLRRYDWVETESTWNIYKTGSNWGTAGALNTSTDHDTTNRATTTVPAGYGWMSWDILAHVSDAISNHSDIVNLLIRNTNGVNWDRVMWYSNNYAADLSLRPKITLTYHIETSKSLAGTMTPSGTITRTISKVLSGTITPTGAITRTISKALTGTLTSSGAITKTTSKALAGVIAMIGKLSEALFSPTSIEAEQKKASTKPRSRMDVE